MKKIYIYISHSIIIEIKKIGRQEKKPIQLRMQRKVEGSGLVFFLVVLGELTDVSFS